MTVNSPVLAVSRLESHFEVFVYTFLLLLLYWHLLSTTLMNDFYAIFIFDFCGVIIGIALKTLLKLYLFDSTERIGTSTLL